MYKNYRSLTVLFFRMLNICGQFYNISLDYVGQFTVVNVLSDHLFYPPPPTGTQGVEGFHSGRGDGTWPR